jgi:hypothetical protein
MKQADKLADYLLDHARSDLDTDAAALLRRLGRIADVAREVVNAKNRDYQNAAYQELIDLIKGKAE